MRGGGGMRRLGDGAADHEIVGAGLDRRAWAHDALLVAARGARGPDARHHQQEIGAARLPERRHLEGRADHAIEAAVAGKQGQTPHLLTHRALLADRREVAIV